MLSQLHSVKCMLCTLCLSCISYPLRILRVFYNIQSVVQSNGLGRSLVSTEHSSHQFDEPSISIYLKVELDHSEGGLDVKATTLCPGLASAFYRTKWEQSLSLSPSSAPISARSFYYTIYQNTIVILYKILAAS